MPYRDDYLATLEKENADLRAKLVIYQDLNEHLAKKLHSCTHSCTHESLYRRFISWVKKEIFIMNPRRAVWYHGKPHQPRPQIRPQAQLPANLVPPPNGTGIVDPDSPGIHTRPDPPVKPPPPPIRVIREGSRRVGKIGEGP